MSMLKKALQPSVIRTIKAEIEYFTGFYDDTNDISERLNKDCIRCLTRFTPDNCILRLFAQKRGDTVKQFDEDEPLEVFDLGIAELMIKPVLKEELLERDESWMRLVTVTNVPGHGVKNIVFLFPSGKLAKTWVQAVKLAQENIGLGNICYGVDNRRLSVDGTGLLDNHYCNDVRNMAKTYGVKAIDVVTSRVRDLTLALAERDEEYEYTQGKLSEATSKCEARNEQIMMKQRDIADAKKKILAAQPQKKYKYIIPFGHPHVHDDDTVKKNMTVSEENCQKVMNQRRESRLTDWKRHDLVQEPYDSDIRGSQLLNIATTESRRHHALQC